MLLNATGSIFLGIGQLNDLIVLSDRGGRKKRSRQDLFGVNAMLECADAEDVIGDAQP
jgi:hypothetical protein